MRSVKSRTSYHDAGGINSALALFKLPAAAQKINDVNTGRDLGLTALCYGAGATPVAEVREPDNGPRNCVAISIRCTVGMKTIDRKVLSGSLAESHLVLWFRKIH